ncbi:MAG: hypothetical protein ACE5D1_06465, partial [Fidelibacterota bacterium]
RRRRVDQKLIVIDEPDPQQPEIQAAKSFPLVFTDLAPFGNRTPNVEALFTVDDQYWILTKRQDDRSLLCRIQMNFTDPAAKVEPVQSLAIPGQVTGADYNAHRREVAVLTYTAVYLFQWRPESVPLGNYPRKTIPIFFKQAEGICWDGNAVRIENEQGEMKVISID